MEFWKMGVGSALLVISALSIACTSGAVSQTDPLVTPEHVPAETSVPALTPIQAPAPAKTAPPSAAAEESTPKTAPAKLSAQASAEAAPDELSTYALSQLAILSQTLGPRQSATAEEKEAADYLASQFAEHGFSVQLQPFTVRSFSPDDSGLFLPQGDFNKIGVEPLNGTGSGDVEGQLVSVGLARPEDIPESGLVGKIALAERGLVPFGAKAANIAAAGALGAVIYNNEPGNFRGTLGGSSQIPVAAVSQEDGELLEAHLAVSASSAANLKLHYSQSPSQNVIAEKPGQGTGVVILGAHYDTVPGIAGATDNASGTAVLLTLARELSGKSFPFDLRLIAFGSEELGLRGSRHYVESLSSEQQSQIIAMLNFDALGNGSRLSAMGDAMLTRPVMEDSQARGIELRLRQSSGRGGSDHASFAEVSIPNIFFSSNDFSRLHTPEDTLDSINPQLLGDAVRLALNLLDVLAQDN